MLIRPCTPGEEFALLAVFQSSVRGLARRHYTPEQIEAWAPHEISDEFRAQWRERIRANRPWVAQLEGQLAGFADVQPTGYIDHFFVAAACAGQGVGTALMRHLHALARAAGTVTLSAHVSLNAQPFFERCGFILESEQCPVVRGVALRNAVMRKTLAAPGAQAAA